MREVFRNEYFYIQFDDAARVLWLTRTAVPQDIASLQRTAAGLPAVLLPLRPARMLLDMRQARGNNEPGFEQAALTIVQRLLQNFSVVAVLVQTAVGKLHFQRLTRSSGQALHIYFDEQEALDYLKSQPL